MTGSAAHGRVHAWVPGLFMVGTTALVIAGMWHLMEKARGNLYLILALIGFQTVVCLTAVAVSLRHTKGDLCSPMVAFGVFFLLGYPLAAIIQLTYGSVILDVRIQVNQDETELLERALWVSSAGLVAFLTGFFLLGPFGPVSPVKVPAWVSSRVKFGSLLFAFLSLAGFFALISWLGGTTELIHALPDRTRAFEGANYFAYAPLLMIGGTLLLHGQRLRHPQSVSALTAWVYTAAASLILLLNGSRTPLLVMIAALACMHHYLWRRITVGVAVVLACMLLLLYVTYEMVFREYFILGSIDDDLFGYHRRSFVEGLIHDRVLSGSFIQITTLMGVLDVCPDLLPYQGGQTYFSLLMAPIPRSMYPDKPISPSGLFTAACSPEYLETGSSIPPSFMGELYMNFGWIGVVLGMLVFGGTWKTLYRYLRGCPSTPHRALIYSITWAHMFAIIRGESMGVGVSYLAVLVPAVAVSLLARGRGAWVHQPDRSALDSGERRPAPFPDPGAGGDSHE